MTEIFARPMVLTIICALAYTLATIAIKWASMAPAWPIILAIMALLAGAVAAELVLMRQFHLPVVYIAILTAESMMIIAFAYLLGEGLGVRQLMGAGLVVAGAVLVAT